MRTSGALWEQIAFWMLRIVETALREMWARQREEGEWETTWAFVDVCRWDQTCCEREKWWSEWSRIIRVWACRALLGSCIGSNAMGFTPSCQGRWDKSPDDTGSHMWGSRFLQGVSPLGTLLLTSVGVILYTVWKWVSVLPHLAKTFSDWL